MKPPSAIVQAIILTGLWLILGFSYMARTRDFVRTHDFKSQLIYTSTIALDGRLPNPKECREWSQPPLYYWLASRIAPANRIHPSLVRIVSLLLGALAQLLIFFFLRKLDFRDLAAFGVTLFVTTTPQFVYAFSTYNNDSLSTFLAMAVIFLSLSMLAQPRCRTLVCLFVAALAGVYTKATVINVLLILSVLTAGAWLWGGLTARRALSLLAIYGGVTAIYMPWQLWRSSLSDATLFGFMGSVRGLEIEALRLPHSPWITFLTLPGLSGEWHTPYSAMWEMSGTKKSSLISYLFATSLYGEFEYTQPAVWITWTIVSLHAFLSLAAIAAGWIDRRARIALAAIVLATASYAILVVPVPMANCMDFRYVTWSWMAWAVLYAVLSQRLSHSATVVSRSLVPGAMGVGVLLHAYFLLKAQSLT